MYISSCHLRGAQSYVAIIAGLLRFQEDLQVLEKFNLFEVKLSGSKNQPLDNFDVLIES
jgi:hypothetical protein